MYTIWPILCGVLFRGHTARLKTKENWPRASRENGGLHRNSTSLVAKTHSAFDNENRNKTVEHGRHRRARAKTKR